MNQEVQEDRVDPAGSDPLAAAEAPAAEGSRSEDPASWLLQPQEGGELDTLDVCQQQLRYQFIDVALLRQALTHSSRKSSEDPSNERMEFLGDAVLGLAISSYLYERFPDHNEGELTRIKSVVVSSKTLARESRRLELPLYLRVGKGMSNQGSYPVSLLANVFEAVTGAIYLDGGLEEARQFVLRNLTRQVDAVIKNRHARNFKSILQHHAQKEYNLTPTYRVLREEGPDHTRRFEVIAVIGDQNYESGWGDSKKEAEQRAAEATLERLLGSEQGEEPSPRASIVPL